MSRFLAALLLLSGFFARGAHLVGGDISYLCLGNNSYQITLTIYRDCNSGGAPFDGQAAITIYDGLGNIFQNLQVPVGPITNIPPVVNNPCLQVPPNVCTEYATYITTVTLPPSASGYVITHQRCCRNGTITNIPNPDTWGNTYTVNVPPNGGCNSSPAFNNLPPIVLCLNDSINFDYSATDPDGDSLYYELCTPLHGGGQGGTGGSTNSPAPNPAAPPPYTLVPFLAGYSASFPLPGLPALNVNPQTGQLTGRPTALGQYVFAVCVSEYDAQGALLSTVSRDYQFNVVSCQANTTAEIQDQPPGGGCTGRTIQFFENCQVTSLYLWDFGVDGISTDTSTQANPVYTFPDTGTYVVTLIANPGWPCTDTAVKVFRVYDPFNTTFTVSGNPCFDNQNFTLQATGGFSPTADISWDFGVGTGPSHSGVLVQNVSFPAPGTYPVTVTVSDFGCVVSYTDNISVYAPPELLHNISRITGCAPVLVDFHDSSTASTTVYHEWDFGDGGTANVASPSHEYPNPGTYNVSHRIYTVQGCIDTLAETVTNAVTVLPVPNSQAEITPTQPDPYYPEVTVNPVLTGDITNWETDMGDGTIYFNTLEQKHLYRDTGWYRVYHVVWNSSGCPDTLKVWVRVNPVVHLFIPNAFTPNGDNKNEVFLPGIIGMKEYRLMIFNRWGELLFESEVPEVGWNGRFENTGNPVPQGVYTYRVVARDANDFYHERTGTIHLIR